MWVGFGSYQVSRLAGLKRCVLHAGVEHMPMLHELFSHLRLRLGVRSCCGDSPWVPAFVVTQPAGMHA